MAFSQVKVWGAEILYYADLNAEFANIYTFATPAYLEDYSANITQFRTSSVPSESSLPTTLAGEIEVLRGAIKRGFGLTYWGDAPAITPSYQISPPVSLVWKDAATITVQAGKYYVGGKVYNQAASQDITLAGAGAPDYGLDTGSEANSTWYYIYAVDYQDTGTLGYVYSTTAPTARFDTDLSGTDYDTNTYLGPVYNDSSGDFERFTHCGNQFKLHDHTDYYITHTGDTNYSEETLTVPATALMVGGDISIIGGTAVVTLSADGTNAVANNNSAGVTDPLTVVVPIITAQKMYISTTNASYTAVFYTNYWVDKWL